MTIYHNSRELFCRMPLGAGACGEFVRLRIRAEGASRAHLRLWWEGAQTIHPMSPLDGINYECEIQLSQSAGLLWYFFVISLSDGRTVYYGNAPDELGGEGDIYAHEPPSFQITVYDGAFETPEWMRNGIMMQAMVDRYAKDGAPDAANLPRGAYYHADWNEPPALEMTECGDNDARDFFGGNLRGLMGKLDYIASLGVTALYLNPIFRAASNHKYDTGDYMQIDPSFGTNADFAALCERARSVGIKIVLDGVFSHTGADSRYFNKYGTYGAGGAFNDPNSPFRSWYKFEKYPDKYDCWWGFDTLPNVREEDAAYQDFIIAGRDSVCANWLNMGAAGWRLDVADELPMDFIRRFRARQKRVNPESALIGEVWEDPSNKVAYGELRSYCLGDTLDGAMNYPLRQAIFDFLLGREDAGMLRRRIESMAEKLPKPFLYSQMNLLGSHDKARAISVLADAGNMEPDRRYRYPIELSAEQYQLGRRRFVAAWRLLCALPGMPCLYYGDEAGMTGMADPYCRYPYPWGREDQEIVRAVRQAAQDRRASDALRTGELRVSAYGQDVLVVARSICGGRDALGRSAEDGVRILAVNRADCMRRVEIGSVRCDIAPQSAAWVR